MNRNLTPLLGMLAAAGVVFAGCSSTHPNSGFLTTYDEMTQSDRVEGLYFWQRSDGSLREYQAFLVEPVVMMLAPDAKNPDADPALEKELEDYFREEIIKALTRDGAYQSVTAPGPRVCRVRVAITNLRPVVPLREDAWSKTITGGDIGQATVEIEYADAQSGEVLLTALDRRAVQRFRQDRVLTRFGHAKTILKSWADMNRRLLDGSFPG